MGDFNLLAYGVFNFLSRSNQKATLAIEIYREEIFKNEVMYSKKISSPIIFLEKFKMYCHLLRVIATIKFTRSVRSGNVVSANKQCGNIVN